jgi:hypothetical protein
MDRAAIRDGMTVYSADGRKLGRLVQREDDTLVIERGLFFREDYAFELEEIERIEGDSLHLCLEDDEIESDREYDTSSHRPPGGSPGPAGVILTADDEAPVLHGRARDPNSRR